ncbi:MAG: dinuclear metal center YbgI/SA1388 family protein [Myxococcota bacterium]|jgi:dinuclear metal center YbgI/SA1388 family protein
MELGAIEQKLNSLMKPEAFADYCVNGLQIEGKPEVRRIASGVSLSQRFIEAALDWEADALLVHHGLFWRGMPHPMELRAGPIRDRLKMLLANDLSVFAYHLPLDAHPEVGNNAVLARQLGLANIEPVDVGYAGDLLAPLPMDAFIAQLEAQTGQAVEAFRFGSDTVKRVGLISGASGASYPAIVAAGCDTFVNGDRQENLVREYEESGLNHLFAGHYATECFGPRALGDWCSEELGIETKFIDIPNSV